MPFPRPQKIRAKLADKQVHNEKFTSFQFELVEPNVMTFFAGQYVSIKVDDAGDRRSYSMTTRPDVTHSFGLFVDTITNGLGVTKLKNLQFGEEIELMGPLGLFTLGEEAVTRPVVFVATGAGIAPFLSMIEDQLQTRHTTQELTLYWGNRHETELCLEDQLQEMMSGFLNFHLHPVISQAVPEWPLCRGRVTDCLTVHDLPENGQYMLCGNQTMITNVNELLQKREVKAEDIHWEKFY